MSVDGCEERAIERIDALMLYLEDVRERAAHVASEMRAEGADEHLVVAVESTAAELSKVARSLRQRAFFPAPR